MGCFGWLWLTIGARCVCRLPERHMGILPDTPIKQSERRTFPDAVAAGKRHSFVGTVSPLSHAFLLVITYATSSARDPSSFLASLGNHAERRRLRNAENSARLRGLRQGRAVSGVSREAGEARR